MFSFLKRSVKLAVKLPFTIAWDCVSGGNGFDHFSTAEVIEEYKRQKIIDDTIAYLEDRKKIEDAVERIINRK